MFMKFKAIYDSKNGNLLTMCVCLCMYVIVGCFYGILIHSGYLMLYSIYTFVYNINDL